MKPLLYFILCILVLTSCSKSTHKSGSQDTGVEAKHIDSLFQDFDHLETPGYAVGVSVNDRIIYSAGFGAANLDYNLPITPQSAFSIASVSKQFTAAGIALLILDDKLSLETPVSTYIPELNKYPDTIRVKHLLYNTSGIKDYPHLSRKDEKSWVTFNYFDVDECIAVSLAETTLQFKPGERWDYCNVNFMLLTKIIEKISGTTFSNYMKTEIFDPLEMTHTLINDDITTVIPNRVTPYNYRNQEILEGYKSYGLTLKADGDYIQHPRNSPHYGGSGVVTTMDDLMKWSMNMATGTFGGEEFYDLMHTTLTFNHDRNNQAFGLYIGDFNGREIVAWDGGDWGISSQLMRFPKDKVSIAVLSNIGTGEAFRKVNAIADILIEEGIIK